MKGPCRWAAVRPNCQEKRSFLVSHGLVKVEPKGISENKTHEFLDIHLILKKGGQRPQVTLAAT